MERVQRQGGKVVFTERQKQNIIRLYQEGIAMNGGISSLYDVGHRTIKRRLIAWGEHQVTRRGAYMKDHSLDESYFEPPLSPESMYWAGMLLADGYVSNRMDSKAITSLQLSGVQVRLVQRFKHDLQSGYAIYRTKRKQNQKATLRHRIYSDKIFSDLAKLGVVPAKTGSEQIPETVLAHRYSRHFMRGLFDGDGYVGKKETSIALSGGSDSLHEALESYFGCRWYSRMRTRYKYGTSWSGSVCGDRARHVARVLYGGLAGTTCLYLHYKRRRAMRILATDPLYDDTDFNNSMLPEQLQR